MIVDHFLFMCRNNNNNNYVYITTSAATSYTGTNTTATARADTTGQRLGAWEGKKHVLVVSAWLTYD